MSLTGANLDATDETGILEGYKPSKPYTAGEKERSLITALEERLEDSKKYRRPWDRPWPRRSTGSTPYCVA